MVSDIISLACLQLELTTLVHFGFTNKNTITQRRTTSTELNTKYAVSAGLKKNVCNLSTKQVN